MSNGKIVLNGLLINIAKYAVLVIIAVFVYNVFSQTYADSSITAKQLETEVFKADSNGLKGAETAGVMEIKKIFGLNTSDYEGSIYHKPKSNMDAEELLIIRAASLEQVQSIEDAIDTRLDKQKKVFEGYAPKQYKQLENARVVVKGRFVLYVVSDDADKYASAFTDAIKRNS